METTVVLLLTVSIFALCFRLAEVRSRANRQPWNDPPRKD